MAERPGDESMLASLREARSLLERVCALLIRPSPEVLDRCEGLLVSASVELAWRRPPQPGERAGGRAGAEARLVRKALQDARRLLENAASFHARWQRIRASIVGGYRADGAPGQLQSACGRISLEG